jgi:hypothetical protein
MPHLDMEYVMRRVVSLSVLGLAAGLLTGCDLKEVYPTAIPPLAGLRFINAVPDTAGAYGMDLRFVDILESNAHFRQNFRNLPTTAGGVTASAGVQYKHLRAGTRNFKIFLDDTIQTIATVELVDTTFLFEAGKNYTALLWGYANPGGPNRPVGAPAMELLIVEEAVAAPGTNVELRVINTSEIPYDVRTYDNGGAVPGAATWTTTGHSISTYVLDTPGQQRYNVQPAGGGAVIFADPLALIGAAASTTAAGSTVLDIEALPGTTVAGSAITMIIWPRSTAGTRTPQTAAFNVPAATFVWDRRPPYVNP